MLGGQWMSHNSHHMANLGPNFIMEHSSSSRQMRNEAEKKRRDTLNGYINELARLVPMVDGTPRRVDKISILRLAATYLMQNQILYTGSSRQPNFLAGALDKCNLSMHMIEEMDAFMLVVTAAGKIVFVSHTVERLLGHTQLEMFGQSLFNFTLKEDHSILSHNLIPNPDPENQYGSQPSSGENAGEEGDDTSSSTSDNSSDTSSSATLSPRPLVSATETEEEPPETQKRSFFIQMSQRSVSRTELPEYKRVHLLGVLKIPKSPAAARKTKGKRQRVDWPPGDGIGPGAETVLVAIVKLEHRIKELSLLEASKDEYVTRHLIDGRIIYSDHRISLVAGYLSEEVNGMSAFKFMHPEDVMYTIVALRQMYDGGEGFGCSCYRLQIATGQFIYLRTHGYLEKTESSDQVQSFICINSLVCMEDGERLIQEMKTRYSASIDAANRQNAIEEKRDKTSSLEIDTAISLLIPSSVEPIVAHTPFPDMQYMKAALTSKGLPPVTYKDLKMNSPTRHFETHSVSMENSHSNERPTVITSGSRRRRHDSTDEQESKRRRPDEALTVQVPLHMGAEKFNQQTQECYSPSSTSSMYSPIKQCSSPADNVRRRRSTQESHSYHQDDRGDERVLSLFEQHYTKEEHSSPSYTSNQEMHVDSNQYYPNEDLVSNQVSYPTEPLSSPNSYSYSSTLSPNVSNSHLEEENQSRLKMESTSSPQQSSPCRTEFPSDPSYWNEPELTSPIRTNNNVEPIQYELDEIMAPENEPAFDKLQNNLQVQNVLITSIQHDMDQVQRPQILPLPLYNSLTKIKEEHKQHQIMLKGLKQELHNTLSERNTNI